MECDNHSVSSFTSCDTVRGMCPPPSGMDSLRWKQEWWHSPLHVRVLMNNELGVYPLIHSWTRVVCSVQFMLTPTSVRSFRWDQLVFFFGFLSNEVAGFTTVSTNGQGGVYSTGCNIKARDKWCMCEENGRDRMKHSWTVCDTQANFIYSFSHRECCLLQITQFLYQSVKEL